MLELNEEPSSLSGSDGDLLSQKVPQGEIVPSANGTEGRCVAASTTPGDEFPSASKSGISGERSSETTAGKQSEEATVAQIGATAVNLEEGGVKPIGECVLTRQDGSNVPVRLIGYRLLVEIDGGTLQMTRRFSTNEEIENWVQSFKTLDVNYPNKGDKLVLKVGKRYVIAKVLRKYLLGQVKGDDFVSVGENPIVVGLEVRERSAMTESEETSATTESGKSSAKTVGGESSAGAESGENALLVYENLPSPNLPIEQMNDLLERNFPLPQVGGNLLSPLEDRNLSAMQEREVISSRVESRPGVPQVVESIVIQTPEQGLSTLQTEKMNPQPTSSLPVPQVRRKLGATKFRKILPKPNVETSQHPQQIVHVFLVSQVPMCVPTQQVGPSEMSAFGNVPAPQMISFPKLQLTEGQDTSPKGISKEAHQGVIQFAPLERKTLSVPQIVRNSSTPQEGGNHTLEVRGNQPMPQVGQPQVEKNPSVSQVVKSLRSPQVVRHFPPQPLEKETATHVRGTTQWTQEGRNFTAWQVEGSFSTLPAEGNVSVEQAAGESPGHSSVIQFAVQNAVSVPQMEDMEIIEKQSGTETDKNIADGEIQSAVQFGDILQMVGLRNPAESQEEIISVEFVQDDGIVWLHISESTETPEVDRNLTEPEVGGRLSPTTPPVRGLPLDTLPEVGGVPPDITAPEVGAGLSSTTQPVGGVPLNFMAPEVGRLPLDFTAPEVGAGLPSTTPPVGDVPMYFTELEVGAGLPSTTPPVGDVPRRITAPGRISTLLVGGVPLEIPDGTSLEFQTGLSSFAWQARRIQENLEELKDKTSD